MSALAEPVRLDWGVVIARVRVVVQPPAAGPWSSTASPRAVAARGADHRICIDELRIETDAALSELQAHRFGKEVAVALSCKLMALQEQRLAELLAGRSAGGAVRIGSLVVHVGGCERATDGVPAIAGALVASVQRKLRN